MITSRRTCLVTFKVALTNEIENTQYSSHAAADTVEKTKTKAKTSLST